MQRVATRHIGRLLNAPRGNGAMRASLRSFSRPVHIGGIGTALLVDELVQRVHLGAILADSRGEKQVRPQAGRRVTIRGVDRRFKCCRRWGCRHPGPGASSSRAGGADLEVHPVRHVRLDGDRAGAARPGNNFREADGVWPQVPAPTGVDPAVPRYRDPGDHPRLAALAVALRLRDAHGIDDEYAEELAGRSVPRALAGPRRGRPQGRYAVGPRRSASGSRCTPSQRAAARGTRTCRHARWRIGGLRLVSALRPARSMIPASREVDEPEPLSQLDIGAGRDEPLRTVGEPCRLGYSTGLPEELRPAEAVHSCGPGALSSRRALRDRRGRAPRVRVRVALNRGRYRLTFVATARKRYSS